MLELLKEDDLRIITLFDNQNINLIGFEIITNECKVLYFDSKEIPFEILKELEEGLIQIIKKEFKLKDYDFEILYDEDSFLYLICDWKQILHLSDIPNKNSFNADQINAHDKFAMIYEFIFDYTYASYSDAFANIYDELINESDDYDFSFRHLSLFILRFFN